MKIDNTLSREQCIGLFFVCGANSILYNFTTVVKLTGRGYGILIGLGLLIMVPLTRLLLSFNQNGKVDVFEIIESSCGKIISKALLCIYICLNIVLATILLNFFINTVNCYLLPNTPIWLISLSCVFVSYIFATSGITRIARIFEIITILCFVNYLFTYSIAPFSSFRFDYIWPMMEASLGQMGTGLYIIVATLSDFLLLAMLIMKNLPPNRESIKWPEKGILVYTSIVYLATLLYAGIIGTVLLSIMPHSGISVARFIHVGQFVRGLEIFVLLTYQILAVGKTTLFIYCTKEAVMKLFETNNSTASLTFSAIAVFVGTIVLYSFSNAFWLSIKFGSYVVFPFCIVIILLAGYITYIKNNKKKGSS